MELEGALVSGIDNAIESGYIEETNMNFIESKTDIEKNEKKVGNVNVESKIDNFLMDDHNLSMEFLFNFEDTIKEYVNLDNIHNILINDLIIRDEKNRILYSGTDKESFQKYCKENNLSYIYGETDDKNYINCGLNSFISLRNTKEQNVKLIYNLYATTFPKSQKLMIEFSKISLIDENNNSIIINGDWNMKIDIPENMYNRTSEYYKVVSCSNSDFNIYNAELSDTGFEIGIIINNIEKPEDNFTKELEELRKEISAKYGVDENSSYEEKKAINAKVNEEINEILNSSELYNDSVNNHFIKNSPIDISGESDVSSKKTFGGNENNIEVSDTKSYIENSNGQKFYCTMSPSRKYINKFLAENKFEFYDTFEMTKANSTDKIRVVLYYYGEPVIIELEKMK